MRQARAALAAQRQRLREEIASGVTHGIGLLLAVAAVPVLIVLGALRGDAVHVAGFTVYGSSLVLVYATSTLYHAFQQPRLKHVFRILDHAAIYLLIAGTYTPVTLLSMNGPWGWTLLTLVWALAVFGCVFKLFFVDRYEGFSTVLYLVMGWLVVLVIKPFLAGVPTVPLLWLIAGGLCYTVGVVFFVWERLPYNHAVWHLFVIGGSACHYVAMLLYVW
ncbi:MAG: hemolysin III family protein [Rhodothermales bacterium]